MLPSGPRSAAARIPVLRLLLLTAASTLVQGYHLGADDAAIYIPAIKKAADPALYPFGAEFFMSHARLSLFSNLVGGSGRLGHSPIDLAILLWYVACTFLLLVAAWKVVCACFENQPARWAGVTLLAAAFAVPVAGTALVIMDPYLTARSLSTPLALLAVACFVSGRPVRAAAWWLCTALMHPQMSVYAAVFLGFLALAGRWQATPSRMGMAAIPSLSVLQPAQGAAREALLSRTYFFVSNWAWYEWAGVVAPLGLLEWFARARFRGTRPSFRMLAGTLAPFGLLFTAVALVFAASTRLESYNRLQPMRAIHLVYVLMFLLVGGVLGEYVLGRHAWRWLCLFAPLAAGMFMLQRNAYPSSAHIEWPGSAGGNSWTAAFLWIRGHTPKDAVFALDPDYMTSPGEDLHGFRAVAERSMLADRAKDSGAVSLFPGLAGEWRNQVTAALGWEKFTAADFRRLAADYPVTWVVVRRPGPAGMMCPYQNRELAVCRVAPQ